MDWSVLAAAEFLPPLERQVVVVADVRHSAPSGLQQPSACSDAKQWKQINITISRDEMKARYLIVE